MHPPSRPGPAPRDPEPQALDPDDFQRPTGPVPDGEQPPDADDPYPLRDPLTTWEGDTDDG